MHDHMEAMHPGVEANAHLITARDLPAIAAYFEHLATSARRDKRWVIVLGTGGLVLNAIGLIWNIVNNGG